MNQTQFSDTDGPSAQRCAGRVTIFKVTERDLLQPNVTTQRAQTRDTKTDTSTTHVQQTPTSRVTGLQRSDYVDN